MLLPVGSILHEIALKFMFNSHFPKQLTFVILHQIAVVALETKKIVR